MASTMWIAHQAGIRIFATGGIGGVHRGAESSNLDYYAYGTNFINRFTAFDISADLIQLGKTPVAVVCAGAKSILDIGKTLEVLETQGVNVITYGASDRFPGFFTPETPFKSAHSTASLEEIARILGLWDLITHTYS